MRVRYPEPACLTVGRRCKYHRSIDAIAGDKKCKLIKKQSGDCIVMVQVWRLEPVGELWLLWIGKVTSEWNVYFNPNKKNHGLGPWFLNGFKTDYLLNSPALTMDILFRSRCRFMASCICCGVRALTLSSNSCSQTMVRFRNRLPFNAPAR